ncbi:MAG: MEDS domain-containing protein, partial [Micromonosporaceae bacterium]
MSQGTRSGGGLVHQACLYGSDDDFLGMALPFVSRGLAIGEPVLVAATAKNVQMVQNALGGRADQVDFADTEQFDRGGEERIAGVYDYVMRQRDAAPEEGRIRIISEPVWLGRPAHKTAQSIRIESLANVLYTDVNVWLICGFDTRTAPANVLVAARQTHPELVAGERVTTSVDYVDPYQFVRAQDAQPVPEPPSEAPSFSFTTDLGALRRFVTDHTVSQGLTDYHAEMAVMAVYETASWMRQPSPTPAPAGQDQPGLREPAALRWAAAAARHQTKPMTVRIWAQSGAPVIDLEQTGAELSNPLAGYLPPSLDPAPDNGLWLARMISARLDVRHKEHGSSVR